MTVGWRLGRRKKWLMPNHPLQTAQRVLAALAVLWVPSRRSAARTGIRVFGAPRRSHGCSREEEGPFAWPDKPRNPLAAPGSLNPGRHTKTTGGTHASRP